MFLKFEAVAAGKEAKTIDSLDPPANATGVVLQASDGGVRYVMDNSSIPSQTSGMILRTTDPPQEFLLEDLRRIRFCRDGNADTTLNLHYFAGRDV